MKTYIFPKPSENNKYIDLISKAILEFSDVEYLPSLSKMHQFVLKNVTKSLNCLILNWFEDRVSQKSILLYLLGVIYLLFLRLTFTKIIWVRHNLKPHGGKNPIRYKFLCTILEKIADEKVTHRPYENFKFVPHPVYNQDKSLVNNDLMKRDVDNLCFGQIKKYKGIVELLRVWPIKESLQIYGKCEDPKLEKDIVEIINSRGLDVSYNNQFLSDIDLNLILSRTKRVILPHLDSSMIVSGAFYHAASYGVNISVNSGAFSDYLMKEFDFVNLISDVDKKCYEPSYIFSQISEKCDSLAVSVALKKLISD